jgi:hypothetical protein
MGYHNQKKELVLLAQITPDQRAKYDYTVQYSLSSYLSGMSFIHDRRSCSEAVASCSFVGMSTIIRYKTLLEQLAAISQAGYNTHSQRTCFNILLIPTMGFSIAIGLLDASTLSRPYPGPYLGPYPGPFAGPYPDARPDPYGAFGCGGGDIAGCPCGGA